MSKKLIVIGGTAAGLSAASKAKRDDPSIEVKVFEKSGYVSYGACGLPYFVGDMIKEPMDLVSLTVEELQEKRNIPVFIRHEALSVNRDKKTVTVKDEILGEIKEHPYDALVLATGAHPIMPDIPGIGSKGVFPLRTVEDGIRLKEAASRAKTAAIIGGGMIGLEVAEELCKRGLKVHLIEAVERLLPMLSEEYSELVRNELEKNGVILHLGEPVREIKETDGHVTGIGTEHEDIDCDLAVMCIGVRPESSLAKECGLKLSVKDSIEVDKYMQTSDPYIFACGDCACTYNSITGKNDYIPLGTTANKQGKIAGSNVFSKRESFKGVLGSAVTKCFDLYISMTGLSLERAEAEGYSEAEAVSIKKTDKASYYPGGKDTYLRLIFNKSDGRLLGAQALGGESVAGRINTLAVAISAGMSVKDLSEADLVYAPPVAPVYDPILIAASQAKKHIKK